MLAALAPSAQAAYPGRNGKLVFFQADIGGVDPVGLAVSDADGRNQTGQPLGVPCGGVGADAVPGPCPDDPVWSPDGTRIAFGLGSTLATMKPDGTDVRKLALTGFARVNSPTWSPDGTRIAFAAVRAGRRNVFVVDAAGGVPVPVTNAGGSEPAWSVKDEIAFVRRGDVFRIHAPCPVRPDVACPAIQYRPVRLTRRGGASPTWSPTGNELAFVRRVKRRSSKKRTPVLYRLGRSGHGLKRLTAGARRIPLGPPTASASCSGASTASTPSFSP